MTEPIVVTGGGTGIGRAVVRRLVAGGRDVLAVGRRAEPLAELAAELGERVSTLSADVSTVEGASAVAEALPTCGGVVAAAGGLSPQSGEGLAAVRDAWQGTFAANVLSAALVVEALRPKLAAAGGRVVLLSSIAGLRGSGGGPYGPMKSALHAYCFDLARDLGAAGGTANVLAPGFVPDTGFWDGRRTPEFVAERARGTLVGRPGTPEEVASLVGWLLGPDGGWVTGQILSPNGGAVLGR